MTPSPAAVTMREFILTERYVMAELPCRTRLMLMFTLTLSLITALFSAGCAQVPGSGFSTVQGNQPATDWPTPTFTDTATPIPPEPTLLPRAEMPPQKQPEKRRAAPRASVTLPSTAMVDVAPAPPLDVWQRIRGGFQMAALDSTLVHNWEMYYASRPEYFARMIDNSRHFLFHIITEVERRGMPAEIALLPMIESAYNPVAYSSANASGIWQFIPSTGKTYGLKQNSWYDGRRDVIAATNAALDYLQNLYSMFKDWELALASYNWGEGAVQRAVDRNQARGLSTSYQSLTNMPAETRNYLPKLIAVKNIIAEPERFGLSLAPVPNEPYFETITVKRHIDVALAAKFSETTPEEFRFLNPAHNKPVINSNSAETIVLPKHKVAVFMENFNENENKPLASWKTYTVKAGDRPETIAARHRISVAELNRANNIVGRRRIATGQTILVPSSGELQPELAEVTAPALVAVAARRAAARAPVRKAAPAKRTTAHVPAKPAARRPAERKPIAHTASR